MACIMRKVFLTFVVVFAFSSCTNGQGGLLGNTLQAILKLLESLLTQTGNLTVSLLTDLLGLNPLTIGLNSTLSGIIKTLNGGLGLTVRDVQNLLKLLNVTSILQLPFGTLEQLARYVNITAILELEKRINRTVFG
ncbi:uncharacterized protein LOC126744293 [Anthonomus grandis grandis]|uniref:uncharacterized protein LOC126744293 n=1 Tax=Anthonomus grandis grandis TaxID=2921223 RepID=UPI0021659606|nr:uncharacterized protein LOC126744293 [Anthonomus grandis grandis]